MRISDWSSDVCSSDLVAHAVAEFEPVTVVVDPAEVEEARKYLSEKVDIVEAPLNDAWMRDIGPTFVLSDEGRLGGVDWVFNGWGAQDWAHWDKDSKIGAFVVEQSGAQLIDRSEGRRVGKASVSTCRSRWSPNN